MGLFIRSACLVALCRAIILDRILLSQWYPYYQTEYYFYLTNRNINSIASNTFNGLTDFYWLIMHTNQLSSSIFNKLLNLEYLNLNNNLLISMDRLIIVGLPNLQRVYMANNPISLLQSNYILSLCLAFDYQNLQIFLSKFKETYIFYFIKLI